MCCLDEPILASYVTTGVNVSVLITSAISFEIEGGSKARKCT